MNRCGSLIASAALVTLSACASEVKRLEPMRPCPSSPNCVSTLADDPEHRMAPLRYELPEPDVQRALREALQELPRAELLAEEPGYLHFEVRSRWFRFVDDVEFRLDPEQKLIHFRSASRTGYSDLGVNRKRMEAVSEALTRRPGISPTD